MPIESCIRHYGGFFKFNDDFHSILGRDSCATVVLGVLEFWTNGELSRMKRLGQSGEPWIEASVLSICEECRYQYSDKPVRTALSRLKELNFIHYDDSIKGGVRSYLLNPSAIQAALDARFSQGSSVATTGPVEEGHEESGKITEHFTGPPDCYIGREEVKKTPDQYSDTDTVDKLRTSAPSSDIQTPKTGDKEDAGRLTLEGESLNSDVGRFIGSSDIQFLWKRAGLGKLSKPDRDLVAEKFTAQCTEQDALDSLEDFKSHGGKRVSSWIYQINSAFKAIPKPKAQSRTVNRQSVSERSVLASPAVPQREIRLLPISGRIAECAKTIREQHPSHRRCNQQVTEFCLQRILEVRFAGKQDQWLKILRAIERRHKRWSESTMWNDEGGKFTPNLAKYLACSDDDMWDNDPPVEGAQYWDDWEMLRKDRENWMDDGKDVAYFDKVYAAHVAKHGRRWAEDWFERAEAEVSDGE